jgi:hypothetical protein
VFRAAHDHGGHQLHEHLIAIERETTIWLQRFIDGDNRANRLLMIENDLPDEKLQTAVPLTILVTVTCPGADRANFLGRRQRRFNTFR